MTDIRRMQLEIVSIMEKVDALFQREGITYTLLGGSVLGAVRHGGFIPWDDDMDIGVFRKDFARVEQLLSRLHPYQYERAEEHIVPDAPIGHLHLVNDTYTISNSPTIDVFALDTIPSDRRKWKRLRMTANLHHLAVLGRAPEHRGWMNKVIFSIFFKIVSKKILSFIKRKTLKSITDCSGYDGKWTGNIFGAYTEREYFPTEMYAELERRNFETLSLPVPKQYDEYLTQLYGDYMMLPPLEQRVPKHRDI